MPEEAPGIGEETEIFHSVGVRESDGICLREGGARHFRRIRPFRWATCNLRAADVAGKYAIWIHDNQFYSNHLFASTGSGRGGVNMTIRIEKNTFTLARDPAPVAGHAAFRNLGAQMEQRIKAGGNRFVGMQP